MRELIFLDWNGFFCESNLKEFLKKFEKLNYMDGKIYISKIDRIVNESIFRKIYNKLLLFFFVFYNNKNIPKSYRNIRDIER